jgi:hypothetical protein
MGDGQILARNLLSYPFHEGLLNLILIPLSAGSLSPDRTVHLNIIGRERML